MIRSDYFLEENEQIANHHILIILPWIVQMDHLTWLLGYNEYKEIVGLSNTRKKISFHYDEYIMA